MTKVVLKFGKQDLHYAKDTRDRWDCGSVQKTCIYLSKYIYRYVYTTVSSNIQVWPCEVMPTSYGSDAWADHNRNNRINTPGLMEN